MHTAVRWQPLKPTRTYERVLDQIEEQIMSGNLGVGDRLPPERDLAAMLGVSRAALREALRVLEAQGVLRRPQVGAGPDSGSVIAGTPSFGLSRMLRLHVGLANFPIDDVVEARVVMERASARLAAGNAAPEHLTRMGELLDRMDEPGLPKEEFNDLDAEFHVALAEAAGNRLIADMTIALREAMRHTLLVAFGRIDDWTQTITTLRAEHRAVFDVVAAGNGEAAAKRVEAHIRGFFQ